MISNEDNEDIDFSSMLSKAFLKLLIVLVVITLIGISSCSGQSKNDYIKLIEGHGIEHPDIVYQQMMLESGNLKCTNCSWSNNNNPFGFFYKGSYLTFDNLEHALDYYKWWQGKLYHGGDYYEFLTRVGYATDPNYITKLKQI